MDKSKNLVATVGGFALGLALLGVTVWVASKAWAKGQGKA